MKLTGTISMESYISIKKFMLSPVYKALFIFGIAAGGIVFTVLAVAQHDLAWLFWTALWIFIGQHLYKTNLRNIVNKVLGQIKGIRDGKTFDLELSFDDDAIRVHNRATNIDTALSYELFNKWAETDDCIALFIRTGTYLLVPKSNMSSVQHDEVMKLLMEKCPGLRQRRF